MRTIRKIEQKISGLKQRKKVAAYARVSMDAPFPFGTGQLL